MRCPIHCPKCNWKLNVKKDHYGWFVECIGCGFTRDVKLLQMKNKTGAAAKKR